MYLPKSYTAQLWLMLISMFCWGSWANTVKMTADWRFQSFYWDYVIGVLLGSIVWGVGPGGGSSFLSSLSNSPRSAILLAILSGVVFNAANQLLVAAIEVAGLAVAFPIGIGLALVLGVTLNYILAPAANPLLLFGGVILVALAIIVDALAYRKRERGRREISRRGIVISLTSGVLMGAFYPILTRAMQEPLALGPYTVVPYFAIGVALCALPLNQWMMRQPLSGSKVSLENYATAKPQWHLWALLGGFLWDCGLQCNLIASQAKLVGPAVSYAIGQGATMITAAWGVFVWREFRDAPPGTNRLLAVMFLLFLTGLSLIALAPLWHA